MDLKKFRKNLNRINDFDDWSNNPKEKLSRVERDVLLDYIRKLYDAVLSGEYESSEFKKNVKNKFKTQYHSDEQAKIVITDIVKKSEKLPESRDNTAEEIRKSESKNAHSSETDNKVIKMETEAAVNSGSADVALEKKEENLEMLSVPEIKIPDDLKVSDEFLEIFTDKVTHELSEKLSMMPLSDLRKAFGINEKIFTVNELFGSDMKYFDMVISELNEVASFDEAKNYILKNLVSRFKWDEKSNHKKVETFIRTVRRRYLI